MKIGIIGAMEEEISRFKDIYNLNNPKNIANLDFYNSKFEDLDLVFVKSGMGKVNAACCAQILISNFSVDIIINVGIAGGVNPELNKGDIVVSTNVSQHDFDLTYFGAEKGMIIDTGKYFNADERLISLIQKTFDKTMDVKLFIGPITSGDIFVSDKTLYKSIETNFGAFAVEMEGGAIGQVCSLNKIPFIVIRSISDSINNKAEFNLEVFVKESVVYANHASVIVSNLIKSIGNNF